MRCEDLLSFIKEKWEEFQKGEYYSFKDFVDENGKLRKDVLKHGGVYVVYEGEKPIYVGSAGKGKHVLRYRIGDLFSDYSGKEGERRYYHTLTRKLLKGKHKRFNSLEEVRSFYLEKCKVKILEVEPISKAKLMEAFLIDLLKPKYNSETEEV